MQLCIIFHKSTHYESIERINVNHMSIEERPFKCHGSDVVAFLAKEHCHQAKKICKIKDRGGGRRRRMTRKEKGESLCVSEEAWESSVHRRELRKCGKEGKHDQSSRSSATTVNHTSPSPSPHARDGERGR